MPIHTRVPVFRDQTIQAATSTRRARGHDEHVLRTGLARLSTPIRPGTPRGVTQDRTTPNAMVRIVSNQRNGIYFIFHRPVSLAGNSIALPRNARARRSNASVHHVAITGATSVPGAVCTKGPIDRLQDPCDMGVPYNPQPGVPWVQNRRGYQGHEPSSAANLSHLP